MEREYYLSNPWPPLSGGHSLISTCPTNTFLPETPLDGALGLKYHFNDALAKKNDYKVNSIVTIPDLVGQKGGSWKRSVPKLLGGSTL